MTPKIALLMNVSTPKLANLSRVYGHSMDTLKLGCAGFPPFEMGARLTRYIQTHGLPF